MNDKMENVDKSWFSEARFGMFIHWGLYCIPARDMWHYFHEQIDKSKYERLFSRFNPIDYNPAEWAKLAKIAGMKYAVLIVKHHEGFCMWDSKYTDFKVTNTPYGKDILRMWVDAFRAEGLRIGLYYSLLDWHHPHFTVDYLHPQKQFADELNKDRDFSIYVEYMHNQVCELMTEYGKIDIFWPDFSYATQPETGLPGKSAPEWKSIELKKKIVELQPGILINERLGMPGETSCDFVTPEQYIPSEDESQKKSVPMWEACETIGSSWGYYRGDNTNKPLDVLVKHLVTCVSNNGNLLLNVGPTPRGQIQPEFVELLHGMGKWLEIYGDSVYKAGASKYKLLQGCPELHPVFTAKDNNLYMHFFKGQYPPYNIVLKELGGKVEFIEFLNDKTDIEFEEIELDGKKHIRLHMPVINPDPNDVVINIVLKQGGQSI